MRHFEIKNERHGETGGHRRVAMMFCSECPRSVSIPVQTASSLLPDEIINKKFASIDWHPGSTHKSDLCPDCFRKKPKTNGAPMTPHLNGLPTDAANPIAKSVGGVPLPPPGVGPEPTREMSRDDRRIIYGAIAAHYPEGGKAYESGWSDQRVATETKMPRKWIEDIRAQFFGDAGGNPEMEEYLAQFTKLHADAKAFLDHAMVIRKRVDDILADHLFANVQQISERQGELDKLAAKVKKHIVS